MTSESWRNRNPREWRPIEDSAGADREAASHEVKALADVWSNEKDKLEDARLLREFNARLIRSWSIETGLIEGIYALDEGVTKTLVEHGIEAALIPHGASDMPAAKLVDVLGDHMDAAEGLFAFVKGDRKLSNTYIRELHQLLTRHQETCEAIDQFGKRVEVELSRGEWKRLPNNPGDPATGKFVHVYCPPEQVDSEMDRLIRFHAGHDAVPPDVEAAWLHHRFAQIHPFQDGNGRVARALATLVFLRAGWFPLVVKNNRRKEYIQALERADAGDLRPLIKEFGGAQKECFVDVLALGRKVLDDAGGQGVAAIISDAAERLKRAGESERDDLYVVARDLAGRAQKRFEAISDELNESVRGEPVRFTADSFVNMDEQAHWFTGQIIETARALDYYADLGAFRRWAQLRVRHGDTTARVVVSFHHLGHRNRGVLAASAFVQVRSKGEDGESEAVVLQPACTDVFTITAARDRKELESAFDRWLEAALAIGLEAWRRTL